MSQTKPTFFFSARNWLKLHSALEKSNDRLRTPQNSLAECKSTLGKISYQETIYFLSTIQKKSQPFSIS